MKINIYTDGSCLGNPGPGGWAYLIEVSGQRFDDSEGAVHTTNNRMELQAVIEAIKAVESKKLEGPIVIHSDSAWVVNTMTKNWKRKKNLDLWEDLIPRLQGKDVSWQWVKAHAGHPQNEDCDTRAFLMAKHYKSIAAGMDPEVLQLPGDAPKLF